MQTQRDWTGAAYAACSDPRKPSTSDFSRSDCDDRPLAASSRLRGCAAGLVGGAADADDVAVDVAGAVGRLLHVAGDFARRRALLIDGGGDLAGDFVDLGDGAADRLDRADGFAGGVLDALDLRGNFLGRLRGLVGERLDFAGDHGKSPAVLAGARRFDRGVQAPADWSGSRCSGSASRPRRSSGCRLASPSTTALVRRASSAALPAISAERVTCWAMLLIEAVSSSVADATVSTFGRGLRRCGRRRGRLPRGFRVAAAHRRGQALHFAGRYRDRLDDAADLAFEAGGEFAPRRVAIRLALCSASLRSALARASAALAASASAVFWAVVSNRCESL